MRIISLTDAKNHLSEVVTRAAQLQERVAITRSGEPAAYLLSPEELASLDETAFWAAVPGVQESVAAAQEQRQRGDTFSTAEVRQWVDAGMAPAGPGA
ncbi:MAG: type II toxin-antitoxin system Phd/YefM family antitoxin [Bifidobacteriaceae bacterium]|jgi:prevent-host-death family protein|nr:type II toxin-antitoxin system Phd/YefM family antitoxin [Bifidobacteriaceae bacterium]